MSDRQTEAMIDEIYDASKEDTLLSMVGELYSRRMLPSLLVHGVYSLPFVVLAVYCGIKFSSLIFFFGAFALDRSANGGAQGEADADPDRDAVQRHADTGANGDSRRSAQPMAGPPTRRSSFSPTAPCRGARSSWPAATDEGGCAWTRRGR